MAVPPTDRRQVLAWSFYDWANSAFATVVIAGFFPVFFKQFWAADLAVTDSTRWLGYTSSTASLILVCMAPLLGALADQLGAKKRFLLTFTTLGVLGTGGLFWLAAGHWGAALALYLFGLVGFLASNVFYDSLITDVADPGDYERVSSLGYALGYLGGGLLFALNVVMVQFPASFGFADAGAAVQAAFLGVALWWALFTLPLAFLVKEPPGLGEQSFGGALRGAFSALAQTFRQVRSLRNTFLFLIAYWFYIDGVDTIVFMAVDFGLSLKFPAASLMVALLITQFVGFPAALIFGRLGSRWGPKPSILLAIGVYMLVVAAASQMQQVSHFYALAVAIGLVQGGVQALSRALFAGLIPAGQTAELFGFYNMVGKFGAVLGPFLVGTTAYLTGDPRLSLLPILLLFLIGAVLLTRVDVAAGRAAAGAAS
ncbi:MFS transporter [Candidatus Thiodictyon syntrophicum]|jgi:UMF1 family MFS transporter|uniref:MFS transporter n=1 Tax=Candidatus Thiodictyon syntrophicum TaxID=1166950 RepID=A0A2K8U6U8_9GAMM|nr:MFS transporter [Candidatus Thiodictyon syntrophicum]